MTISPRTATPAPTRRKFRPSGSRLRRATVRVAAIATIVLGSAAVAVPAQASFPGRNGRIVFHANAPVCCDIFTVRLDGTGVRRLTHLTPQARAVTGSWSPDGRHIVYRVDHPGASLAAFQVWVMNSDGTGQRRLVADPFFEDFAPSYSPDGSKVVFTRCRSDFSACPLYRVDADGTHLRALTPTKTEINNFDAKYSPDGRHIAFSSFSRGGVQGAVYVMNADGSGVRRLTPAWLGGFLPDWSPDSRRLVISNNCCTGTAGLWRINADGTGLTQLTRARDGRHHDFPGIWAPSGQWIVFGRAAAGFSHTDMWLMRPDGTGAHLIRRNTDPTGWGSAP